MTPVLNRREQRFAELVDEAGRHRRTDLDPQLAPLVTLATRLGESRPVAPLREEYRLGLWAMLSATMDREGLGATAVIPAQRTQSGRTATSSPSHPSARRRRTRVAMLIGVTGALALSGVSQASVNARPGDPLYSVKRSAERAQLALAGSDVARGKLLLDYASTRLHEARQVGPELRSAVLADMNAQSIEGFRLLADAAVTRRSQAILAILDGLMQQRQADFATAGPALQADVRWSESEKVLNAENERRDELRQWLDHQCGPTLDSDRYGPKPTECTATSSEAGG